MVTIKVFLASSSELEDDRRAFEIFVGRKNKEWVPRGAFLELVLWEDFLDVLSKTRLQDEYNAAVRACHLFVMLFWTKVGPRTEEEFDAAIAQFQANGNPLILVYFKDVPGPAGTSRDADRASLESFQAKLKGLGHDKTDYDHVDRLTVHFAAQLDKLAAGGFLSLDREEEGRWQRPFQAPAPDADHVPRPEVQALEDMLVGAQGTLRSVTVGLHGFGGVGKTTLARLLCAQEAVRRACRDGILWIPVGKNPADLRAQLADLVVALVGDAEGCQTLSGARSRLQSLLAGRRVLVVLDDVWNEAHVRDVLQASAGCARLITTRNVLVLPSDARTFDLEAMAAEESTRLLGSGLPPGLEARLDLLAARLGRWPVLLGLVNRVLRVRISRQKTPAAAALDTVERELKRKGVQAFDPAGPVSERDQAVAATIDASLDLLQPDERQRYAELAIAHAGLDPGAQNPDMPMPTRGLYLSDDVGEATATTRYLAEVDGPWLVAHAATDPARGTAAFERYLSVYTNYSYAEYRHATMWLLLRDVLRFPRVDGGPWVRDTLVRILGAALGGARVEFEDGLAIAVRALRARIGDAGARQALETEADRLAGEAQRMRSGPSREASDIWGLEKRRMLAHAQALGWLLGDRTRALRLLAEAQAIADSGFAGFQAQACLALAEGIAVVERGGHPAALDAALASAQQAVHNVQDVSFCARITSRVNAMRRHWWTAFELDQRARSTRCCSGWSSPTAGASRCPRWPRSSSSRRCSPAARRPRPLMLAAG
jgi:hypothetical protein